MFKEIKKCRICGNANLAPILDLGIQSLTGVFPKSKDQAISAGPLELIKCQEDKDGDFCGLVQLKHSYELDEMFGENYGYRSGLNQSMIEHLKNKVKKILSIISLKPGDLILDIGSNDSTLLQAYPKDNLTLVGVDPTGKKFKEYYPDHIQLIPDFFAADKIRAKFGSKKVKVITSIAMFYDLESPLDFMRQIYEVLDHNGVWVFEQSYLPAMLKMNAYDTVCHEHLEYYRLQQIKWMADRVGFKIIDIEFNDINGGSFSVTVAKSGSDYKENKVKVNKVLNDEGENRLSRLVPYKEFKLRVLRHRKELINFVAQKRAENKILFGYGASTKGNVILQYCGFKEKDVSFVAEVNKDKFGCYTPGTLIPIISEAEAKSLKPDYFMVLPWHFKEYIIQREKTFLAKGGHLLFPLPQVKVV